MDHLCIFCLVFVMPLCASFYLCLVVTCWERLSFVVYNCEFVSLFHQVWYLIVSFPDLCILTYFDCRFKSLVKTSFDRRIKSLLKTVFDCRFKSLVQNIF